METKKSTKWKLLALAAMLTTGTASAADQGNSQISQYYTGAAPLNAEAGEIVYDDVDYSSEQENLASSMYDDAQALQPVAFVGDHQVGSGVPTPAPIMDDSYVVTEGAGCSTGDCGSSYEMASSCGSACGGSCGKCRKRPVRGMMKKHDMWVTAEALLWFTQARSTPALITQNTAGADPELDVPGTSVLFGGDEAIGGDMTAGFRIDIGRDLSDDFGVGGRFWWLSESSEDASSGGIVNGNAQSIGRPFFDTNIGSDNSILIASTGVAGNDDFEGSYTAESSLDIYAAEAYARMKMLSGSGFRSDLIGGFSHFGIDDTLTVRSTSIQTTNALGGNIGDRTDIFDQIETENRFYGGQIGFDTSITRGKWTLKSLTKVHLGNMEQIYRGIGSRTFDDGGGAVTSTDGGVLALGNTYNTTDLDEDKFTFAPEANIKLAYQFRPNVSMSVGYSFIYWDDVLLSGDNINNVYNGDGITFPAAPLVQPVSERKDSSLYTHGIDLGCVIDF
ncbi:BBP7 family outer membrane beta-barrel protein [Rhodopirellula halodulae]|uniref:BBP7 family outer membrane beta-barrel protein n=1 Tax=Rhodopirellula halodulae TaxID=2894198 RepID=UPI001E388E0A|nr:BBP7 family outer membrane beta-barrel protein [Rhodopirellula sp. JC737]MCC9655532.1 BBP7 family outer membrane beta-barrel protein [Rhodopirellula sp. JC737]